MGIVATVVLLVVAFVSVWALRRCPDALSDILSIWKRPWGKQIFVDFYGLEIVLLLWMATHAQESGSWLVFGVCAVTMPALGAMSAAAYWIVAVA